MQDNSWSSSSSSDPSSIAPGLASTGASGATSSTTGGHWERGVLENLLNENLKERRAKRRWSIFFRLAWLAFFVWLALRLWSDTERAGATPMGDHTGVINVEGVIDAEGKASAERINRSLRTALEATGVKGVILRINSPGGSPVQANAIFQEIRRLRTAFPQVPIHAVVDELCASGGYYIAAGADKIFVDQASLIGSIGVRMDGFGLTGLMDKLGVERRSIAAGEHKEFLDPFSAVKEDERLHAQKMLGEVHQQFISAVKLGRGERLKNDPTLFSGLVWTGARSVELGLSDALGSVESVARDVLKAPELVDYSPREDWSERLAKRIGASFGVAFGKTVAVAQLRSAGFR